MEPETIFYVTCAVACLAVSRRAGSEDRPASPFCASVLLGQTVLANIGCEMGVRNAGGHAAAGAMILILFALFRFHRPWTLPLACLSVTGLIVRGIFEAFDADASLYFYKIAVSNFVFVLEMATIAAASFDGGKRGEQFGMGDHRSGGSHCVDSRPTRSKK